MLRLAVCRLALFRPLFLLLLLLLLFDMEISPTAYEILVRKGRQLNQWLHDQIQTKGHLKIDLPSLKSRYFVQLGQSEELAVSSGILDQLETASQPTENYCMAQTWSIPRNQDIERQDQPQETPCSSDMVRVCRTQQPCYVNSMHAG